MSTTPPLKTRGLIAAPFTPMLPDGGVNLAAISGYADWLHRESVVGAFICGTTGEGPSLTVPERLEVAEAWVATAPPGLRVIVHVGHNSLIESKRMAAHAAAIGAGAVACMPPYFFKPAGVDGLVDWCAEVAGAAPQLPFYYYHIPSMSGVYLPMADLLTAATRRIPNFVGIKFTYEDLEDYRNCLEYEDGRYDILFGRDEILLSAVEVGCRGAVGSTYNFAAPVYQRLLAAYEQGDLATARRQQELAVAMIDVCIKGSWHPIAAFKWLMQKVGVDCGPTRLPIPNLTGEQIGLLDDLLRQFLEGDFLQTSQTLES